MCLLVIAYRAHADYPLVVAANRDEWFRRPTALAHFWKDAPHLLAGRDLEQGGTWLGITRDGRFAAVTNFREGSGKRDGAPSRGGLVSEFLTGATSPEQYLRALEPRAGPYSGFNLFAGAIGGEGAAMGFFSNRNGAARLLAPGVYGLSNAMLDDPWPKVVAAKASLAALLRQGPDLEALLNLLRDRSTAPDHLLPATGVSAEWERKLSAMHILADDYGTRSSTALMVARDGRIALAERTYDQSGAATGTVTESFVLRARTSLMGTCGIPASENSGPHSRKPNLR